MTKHRLYLLLVLLAVVSMTLLFRHKYRQSERPGASNPVSTAALGESRTFSQLPVERIGAEVPGLSFASPTSGSAAEPTTQELLQRVKRQAEALYARHPDLRAQILTQNKLDSAIRYAEFFSQYGIVGKQRDLLLTLLAERMDAPNRGELGEKETQDIRQLLGQLKYSAFEAFTQIEPGLQRADEIVARLREAKIELGEKEREIRAAAATSVGASDEIGRRVYRAGPLDPSEERGLYERSFARYQSLRSVVEQSYGPQALAELDSWIDRKIRDDLEFTKGVIRSVADRKR